MQPHEVDPLRNGTPAFPETQNHPLTPGEGDGAASPAAGSSQPATGLPSVAATAPPPAGGSRVVSREEYLRFAQAEGTPRLVALQALSKVISRNGLKELVIEEFERGTSAAEIAFLTNEALKNRAGGMTFVEILPRDIEKFLTSKTQLTREERHRIEEARRQRGAGDEEFESLKIIIGKLRQVVEKFDPGKIEFRDATSAMNLLARIHYLMKFLMTNLRSSVSIEVLHRNAANFRSRLLAAPLPENPERAKDFVLALLQRTLLTPDLIRQPGERPADLPAPDFTAGGWKPGKR